MASVTMNTRRCGIFHKIISMYNMHYYVVLTIGHTQYLLVLAALLKGQGHEDN